MFRTIVSMLALACALALQPPPLFAAQDSPATQPKAAARRSTAKPPVSGLININTASETELVSLPGIGARTAERIVEYRRKNGPFKKIEELMNVRGVGEKNFLKLKDHLTVGSTKTDRAQAPER